MSSCYNLESTEHFYINFALAAFYPINSGVLLCQYNYILQCSSLVEIYTLKKEEEKNHAMQKAAAQSRVYQ